MGDEFSLLVTITILNHARVWAAGHARPVPRHDSGAHPSTCNYLRIAHPTHILDCPDSSDHKHHIRKSEEDSSVHCFPPASYPISIGNWNGPLCVITMREPIEFGFRLKILGELVRFYSCTIHRVPPWRTKQQPQVRSVTSTRPTNSRVQNSNALRSPASRGSTSSRENQYAAAASPATSETTMNRFRRTPSSTHSRPRHTLTHTTPAARRMSPAQAELLRRIVRQ